MKNKTLYLHIGTGKTGTSALQDFFYNNRTLLAKEGIVYPKIGMEFNAHHRLMASCYEATKRKDFMRYPNIKPLSVYLDQLKRLESNALLSSELMWHGRFAHKIQTLKDFFDVKIVAYVRRQDSLLISRFNQHAKVTNEYFKDVMEFFPKVQYAMDYSLVLGRWAKIFGKENVFVRVYEKQQFEGGNIFIDFLTKVLGLKITRKYKFPAKEVNPRLLRSALKYKLLVNLLKIEEVHKHALLQALLQYSQSKGEIEKDLDYENVLLSPADRLKVIQYYSESNTNVANEYLNRVDGKLFNDPLPDVNESQTSCFQISPVEAREIASFLSSRDPMVYKAIGLGVGDALRSKEYGLREAGLSILYGFESFLRGSDLSGILASDRLN